MWSDVVGQAAGRRPAARARRGRPGPRLPARRAAGQRQAGRGAAFAAALLSSRRRRGASDVERHVRLALAEQHPDLTVVERDRRAASHRPGAGDRAAGAAQPGRGRPQGAGARRASTSSRARAPMLLKIIEEPPPSTVFVILAEDVPPELVTIASRCVRIDFGPSPSRPCASGSWPRASTPDAAAAAAGAAGGDLDRARLLATDPRFAAPRRVAGGADPARRHRRHGRRAGRRAAGRSSTTPRARSRPATRRRSPSSRSGSSATASGAPAGASSTTATSASSAATAPTSCASAWPRWPAATATRSPCPTPPRPAHRGDRRDPPGGRGPRPQPERAAVAAGPVPATALALTADSRASPRSARATVVCPARVAQSAEQLTRNEQVEGSIPFSGSL